MSLDVRGLISYYEAYVSARVMTIEKGLRRYVVHVERPPYCVWLSCWCGDQVGRASVLNSGGGAARLGGLVYDI